MAKNMALIENGTVINLLWCADREPETANLADCGEKPVAIGDSFRDGKFFREGQELLSEKEELRAQNEELLETVAAMVEEVYESDLDMIGGE